MKQVSTTERQISNTGKQLTTTTWRRRRMRNQDVCTSNWRSQSSTTEQQYNEKPRVLLPISNRNCNTMWIKRQIAKLAFRRARQISTRLRRTGRKMEPLIGRDYTTSRRTTARSHQWIQHLLHNQWPMGHTILGWCHHWRFISLSPRCLPGIIEALGRQLGPRDRISNNTRKQLFWQDFRVMSPLLDIFQGELVTGCLAFPLLQPSEWPIRVCFDKDWGCNHISSYHKRVVAQDHFGAQYVVFFRCATLAPSG